MAGYSSIFRAGLFSGQLCVVTGGGSGIGRCTAHELAALGARVVLLGRKPERLAAVQAEEDQRSQGVVGVFGELHPDDSQLKMYP